MRISESKVVLASMLRECGVARGGGVTTAGMRTAVEVFRRFVALPVGGVAAEEDGDGVLAQFGTVDFRGRREFSVDLTRQLIEGDRTWQVSCAFRWDSSVETESLSSGHLWSFGLTAEDFFAEAIALRGWAWALAGRVAPRDFTVALDEV